MQKGQKRAPNASLIESKASLSQKNAMNDSEITNNAYAYQSSKKDKTNGEYTSSQSSGVTSAYMNQSQQQFEFSLSNKVNRLVVHSKLDAVELIFTV